MATPTRVIPKAAPRSRAIPQAVPLAQQSSRSPAEIAGSGMKISALTSDEMEPVVLTPREVILLVGDTVAGKSYAIYQLAQLEYDLAIAEGREPAKFWIIDTDLSHPKFLAPGYEFAHLAFNADPPGNIYPLPARTLAETRKAVKTILNHADPTRDWAVVDVVNRAYTQAQNQVAVTQGKDLDDEWMARTRAGKGFGSFEASEWNTVRRAFEAAIYRLFDTYTGNVVFLQHLKPIIMHFDGKSKRREMMTLFGALGYKPDGAPELIKTVDTIIACWAVREPEAVTGQLRAVRKFQILKDRGEIEQSPPQVYGRNLFADFWAYRSTGMQVETVSDPDEAAEIEARAEAEFDEVNAANIANAELAAKLLEADGASDDD